MRCLLLHVRSIFNPVSTWWPENCSPQISDHVCHMSASRLTHVNERARTMRLSALSSARAKRSTENLSRFYVLTTSRYSLSCVRSRYSSSCVRLAAAPHSCSTKRSKPFKEATFSSFLFLFLFYQRFSAFLTFFHSLASFFQLFSVFFFFSFFQLFASFRIFFISPIRSLDS